MIVLQLDFNEIINRSHTSSEKWNPERLKKYFGRHDLLCFGVGDMDIKSPPMVITDLIERAQHGIYGYEYISDSLKKSILNWFRHRHKWNIDLDSLQFSPSILSALSILINILTNEGEKIIIQSPVYYPFSYMIMSKNRIVEENKLIQSNGRYEMNFADLEKKASDPGCKMLILCNPHNPVGRVWTEDELKKVSNICNKYNVIVISDEAHSDIVYKNHKYVPFLSLKENKNTSAITCLSPSKTFNLAGSSLGIVISPNLEIVDLYQSYIERNFLETNNVFSLIACNSAYSKGEEWLNEYLSYLEGNLLFLTNFIKQRIPEIKVNKPEGTFFVWLDFSTMQKRGKALEQFLINEARVALDPGYWYGIDGLNYARINIACPRDLLNKGLERIENAIKSNVGDF